MRSAGLAALFRVLTPAHYAPQGKVKRKICICEKLLNRKEIESGNDGTEGGRVGPHEVVSAENPCAQGQERGSGGGSVREDYRAGGACSAGCAASPAAGGAVPPGLAGSTPAPKPPGGGFRLAGRGVAR